MEWQAKWIWDDSGDHPRNHWACFRKEFHIENSFDRAMLAISADTSYILYVNGEQIGAGPVRGWPSEWYYDEYELPELSKGKNVIAVLVQHLGSSTMQYIEGKGGVIAQCDFYQDDAVIHQVVTNDSWKTAVHAGFKKESIRMSNCLPWSEIYDAAMFDERWKETEYEDNSWDHATVLGGHGINPWGNLIPRDIPMLTDEPIFPKKTLSVKEVQPVKQHYSIDLQPVFFPGNLDNNSGKEMQGFLAAELHSERGSVGKVSFTVDAHAIAKQTFKLNGISYQAKNGREMEVELKEGKNFLIADVSMSVHQPTVSFTFDFEEHVKLTAPLYEQEATFTAIGPFHTDTVLQIGQPVSRKDTITPEYKRMQLVSTKEELEAYEGWIKPVPSLYVSTDNVSLLSIFKKDLNVRPVQFQHQHLTIANRSFTGIDAMPEGDPELLIDFGSEWLGDIEFELEAPAGTVFDFFLFESMHQDGRIEHTFSLNNSLRYLAKAGKQRYRSLVSRGFRYMMITVRNLTKPCKIYSVKVNAKTFPTGNAGAFASSDYLLNRTWEISKQTVRMCTQDTMIDCPAYEQVLWTGDSYNISLMNYYLFGNYDLAKRCLKLISKSVYRSPLPESHVPSGWQNVLTAWSLLWMMACRKYYHFTKDEAFIKEVYPELKLTVERFQSFMNQDGVMEIDAWNMLDWAAMDTGERVVAHQNALLVQALRDTAYLAGVVGEKKDSQTFDNRADALVTAINQQFWNEKKQSFIDSIHEDGTPSTVCSIQTNLMAYLTGCVQGERKEIIEKYLVETPKEFVQIQSPFVLFFYYEAMKQLNRMDIILANIRDIYGYMLENDAVTCWEGWKLIDGDFSRSHCHAWSAAPAYVFGTSLLGVSPLEPGFKKVSISPRLHGLKWLKGSVPTPIGIIDIYCKEKNGVVDIDIHLQETIQAEVRIMEGMKVSINHVLYERNVHINVDVVVDSPVSQIHY